jgi:hypothetical protein
MTPLSRTGRLCSVAALSSLLLVLPTSSLGCATGHSDPAAPPTRAAATAPIDPRLAELRRERASLNERLMANKSLLDQLNQTIAEGREPYPVEQMVQQNVTLVQRRGAEAQYQEQYEQLRDHLGEDHPRVQLAKRATDRAHKQATDYEAELRNKTRAYVLDQYKSGVDGLQVSLDQLDFQIAEVQRKQGVKAPSESSGGGNSR